MPDQESRRSINGRIPADWKRLRWAVLDHPAPDRVAFALMRDNDFWLDEPALQHIRHARITREAFGDYIGRVSHPANDDEFAIEVRPDTE